MTLKKIRYLLSKRYSICFYKKRIILACVILTVILLLVVQFGCIDSGTNPADNLPPLPNDKALYVSIDDVTSIGLRIVNANAFEQLDSMNTKPGVPWTVEFSANNSTWYSCWGRGSNYSLYTGDIYPLTIRNSIQLDYANSSLAESNNHNYLVAYINKGIEIYGTVNLNKIKIDTTLSTSYIRITMSKTYNIFYFTKWSGGHLIGFGIYDLDSMKIADNIIVFDNDKYKGLEDVDMVVSPDDRYLFLSGWVWLSGFSGYGSFFVIDLVQKKIINEFSVGAFSQLAISPDGQSVYISDPGGYLYNFPSSHKVWRYDVKTNSMDLFLLTPGAPDRIAVAEDNRTIFISSWQFIINGKHSDIIKVDAASGKIVDSYSVPLDSSGYVTHIVRNIKLGKYTKN